MQSRRKAKFTGIRLGHHSGPKPMGGGGGFDKDNLLSTIAHHSNIRGPIRTPHTAETRYIKKKTRK